jgi:hypothetical protein
VTLRVAVLLFGLGLCGCAARTKWGSVDFLFTTESRKYPNGVQVTTTGPDKQTIGNLLASGTFVVTGKAAGLVAGAAVQSVEAVSSAVSGAADNLTTTTAQEAGRR